MHRVVLDAVSATHDFLRDIGAIQHMFADTKERRFRTVRVEDVQHSRCGDGMRPVVDGDRNCVLIDAGVRQACDVVSEHRRARYQAECRKRRMIASDRQSRKLP